MKALIHVVITLALFAALFVAGNALYDALVAEEYVAYESIMDTFARPEETPAIPLPNFKLAHPRLPHPEQWQVDLIREHNPGYWARHRQQIDSGRGGLYSRTLMAFVDSGSQDLNRLFTDLMQHDFGYRGNEVKHLAVAYDWLHAQWSDSQRQQLVQRTMDGCRSAINVIREERLSPYNVYLYNSPFQNLIYCALAVYKDSPEAEPIMHFTSDLWLKRVLPVWRQIMGKNGGWHEGAEYVGIGIGNAVYQVPAAWRAATGQDFFASESGLRGFLDFLIYRTRPDGTHFRWGDGANFDKQSPDQIALAIEYQHKAAYTFLGAPKKLQPTAYPWGPLTDSKLYDPAAIDALARTRYFDGIGMLVARSNWTVDALYVTFKSGDNYWSHTHLDQGSFTIFHRGALVIDSGAYSGYGSDHHFNYSYQTVAHNVTTVTDPADTVPMPQKQGDPRIIANDGGQRRIGSGWGIEPAPLDLNEWQEKADIYHTARITSLNVTKSGFSVSADLTPAYSNSESGQGAFSSRTRRVERYIRNFTVDLERNSISIQDSLKLTRPDFTVSWILHSIEEPVITRDGFMFSGSPVSGATASNVTATIDDVESFRMQKIGGPGKEFWVDGANYDNNGRVAAVLQKKDQIEPGSWRVEVSPSAVSDTVHFSVELKVSPTYEDDAGD